MAFINRSRLLTLLMIAVAYVVTKRQEPTGAPLYNYGVDQFFDPAKVLAPSSVVEMASIIARARNKSHHIRVLGSGHSWSPVAVSDDILLSLHNYHGVVSVDKERKRASVKGGTTFAELNEILHKNGLALPNLGSVSAPTIAGAIATGTHGTGLGFGNLATLVVEMDILDGSGEERTLSPATDPDLFPAAAVSIGMLGIITEVTLQCVDAFNLEEKLVSHTLDYCLENLDSLAHSAEHVKMWTEIHSQSCQLFSQHKTTKETNYAPCFLKEAIMGHTLELFQWFMSVFTFTTPTFMRALLRSGFVSPDHSHVSESWNILHIPNDVPSHVESEITVHYDDAVSALRDLLELVETKGIGVNFIVEVRFIKKDNFWLSPEYERDSCSITLLQYNPSAWTSENFFFGFYNITRKYLGRPHWGKLLQLTPEETRRLYPKVDSFLAVRKKLDPDGIFLNRFLTDTFGIQS